MSGTKLLGWAAGRLGGPANRAAARLVRQAREARGAGRFLEAAVLYQEASRLRPGQAATHVQCGHMFKESGLLDRAEAQYRRALALSPADADVHLQLGHLHKIAGRLAESEAAYSEALRLDPAAEDARRELAHLQASGWRLAAPVDIGDAATEPVPDAEEIARYALLAPRLAPGATMEGAAPPQESIEVRRLPQ